MSKKFSAQRRSAFLRCLSQTGNVTLSAERAKVSRSWVRLHRSADAAFDGTCREAIAEARERLRVRRGDEGKTLPLPPPASGRGEDGLAPPASGRGDNGLIPPARGRGATREPPEGWAFHEGEELVVNGSNGRRVQVRRAKLSQWTARVERRFLAVLRCTCNVTAACRDVGLWPPSAYAHRRRWPDFARRWDEAIAMGESELDFRIVHSLRRFFDPEIPGPEEPAGGVTISDAIRYLERIGPKRGYRR